MSLYGREHGVRLGGGGPVNEELLKLQRKERLRSLTAEVFDVKNDPYLLRNHVGTFECKLCCTLHRTLESYVLHTEGNKHKDNLARRVHRLNKDKQVVTTIDKKRVEVKQTPRIGRPGYQVFKQLDKTTGAHSLLFRLQYPQIAEGMRPRYRIVSAYEQKVVAPQDNAQYVVFAAEPYETVGFQIPNIPLDKDPAKFLTHWNAETCVFTLQITLKDGFGTKHHKSSDSEQGVLERAQAEAFTQIHAHTHSVMAVGQENTQAYSTMDLWQSY